MQTKRRHGISAVPTSARGLIGSSCTGRPTLQTSKGTPFRVGGLLPFGGSEVAEGEKVKMHFRETTTDTKSDHQMMNKVKGYLENISAVASNNDNAYSLPVNNISNIFTNNNTLTSTVATIQKVNRMHRDKINSLENKLTAETGKAAPTITKTYTSP